MQDAGSAKAWHHILQRCVWNSLAALATAALQELGYSSAEIAAALKGCSATASTEEMVRYALRAMVNR